MFFFFIILLVLLSVRPSNDGGTVRLARAINRFKRANLPVFGYPSGFP